MVVIVNTTTIVQASGLDSNTNELQSREATGISIPVKTVTSGGDAASSQNLLQFGGFDQTDTVIQFGGITQTDVLITESQFESTGSQSLITELKTLSSPVVTFGSPGTSGSVEQFFDNSVPFFFEPSEPDPNTERDFRELAEFMVFSSTNVVGRKVFNRSPGTTNIIGDKSDNFPSFSPVSCSHGTTYMSTSLGSSGSINNCNSHRHK